MSPVSSESERWVPISGFDGYYEVSNLGRVKSLERTIIRANNRKQSFSERIITPIKNNTNRMRVNLYKDGKYNRVFVHRVVALAFIGESNGLQVNHKDGNPINNKADNLEYVNQHGNIHHAFENGLMKYKLSVSDENNIVSKFERGQSVSSLAVDYKISRRQIKRIIDGTRKTTRAK